MDNFKELIEQILTDSGLNKTQFAKKIKMDRSNFLGFFAGTKFFTEAHIAVIAEIAGMSFDELNDLNNQWKLLHNPKKVQEAIETAKKLPPLQYKKVLEDLLAGLEPSERLAVLLDVAKTLEPGQLKVMMKHLK